MFFRRNFQSSGPETDEMPPEKTGIARLFEILQAECGNLLKLNLLFLLSCIPLVTIPPAVFAMNQLIRQMVLDQPVRCFSDYFSAFRKNLGKSYAPYNELGRFQSLFEYASMVAELVGMDVVNVPTMDWAQAAATTARMAQRYTGRREVLVPELMDPDKLNIMRNYCADDVHFIKIRCTSQGLLDRADLQSKLGQDTAGVYFEMPGYLGQLETDPQSISDAAHAVGALSLVGVDPITLGVLEAPANYGADIVCGDLQPLGIHMNYGGGQSGFMATRDEEKMVMEFPSRLFGIAPTSKEGEYGFGDVAYDRTSFGHLREKAKEYVGTQSALWGITAGVYLATMGPRGMEEVGQTMMQNAQYAVAKINAIPGLKANALNGVFMKEFLVDFSGTGKTVEEVNKALLDKKIFGGKDVSKEFPQLGQCALYCVTEIHTCEDIDRLAAMLAEVTR